MVVTQRAMPIDIGVLRWFLQPEGICATSGSGDSSLFSYILKLIQNRHEGRREKFSGFSSTRGGDCTNYTMWEYVIHWASRSGLGVLHSVVTGTVGWGLKGTP